MKIRNEMTKKIKPKIDSFKFFSFKYTRDKRGRSKYTSSIPMLASRVMMITSCSWLAMQHRDSHTFIFQIKHLFPLALYSPICIVVIHTAPNWTVQNSNRKFRFFSFFRFRHNRKACAFMLNWCCFVSYRSNDVICHSYHRYWNLGFYSFVFCHIHSSKELLLFFFLYWVWMGNGQQSKTEESSIWISSVVLNQFKSTRKQNHQLIRVESRVERISPWNFINQIGEKK